MKLKALDTCKFNGSHFLPEVACIPQAVLATAPATEDDTVWITSANDAKHKLGSLHYQNKAFDFRVRNLVNKAELPGWVDRIRHKLGPDYDVLNEGDHIHVEFDKKN